MRIAIHRRATDSRAAWVVVCALVAPTLGACSSHRLSRERGAAVRPPIESLGGYIARVRALTANARSRSSATTQALETWAPRLSAALTELALMPSPAHHRSVALEYRRLGVLDQAYAHVSAALRMDPNDVGAFDLRARIWRDWGFPHLGLSDALRAAALAPSSSVVANTLGTLFEAEGKIQDAQRWYRRALELDPNASYALNNLCYAAIMAKEDDAVDACRRALIADPRSRVARNNLGLAFAAEGDFDRARAEFAGSGDLAATQYNMGILYMARRQYRKAAESFTAALTANPGFARAVRRENEARAAAAAEMAQRVQQTWNEEDETKREDER